MNTFNKIFFIAIGFITAAFLFSFTTVGAEVSREISRVLIANDQKNPVPVFSREALKVKGEMKIDGKPEVKLDGDTKIKIESIDKPVRVRIEKTEAMPETGIFKNGKSYSITLLGETPRRCKIDKINGTWILCEGTVGEGRIVGWVNTLQLTYAAEY